MKVSNVEVYYKAISFYLEQHPDLLVDLLKVASRVMLSSSLICVSALADTSCEPLSGGTVATVTDAVLAQRSLA